MAVIEVSHLSKDFYISKKEKGLKGALHNLVKNEKTTIHSVQDLNFKIEKGEIVAFIGPNGVKEKI